MKKLLLFVVLIFTSIFAGIAQTKSWWGYYNDVKDLCQFGVAKSETYNGAMFVSGQHPVAGGKTISAIRFYLQSKINIKDVKVWLSKKLPACADDADIVIVTNFSKLNEGYNDIELDTPYELSEDGVYVGYSFTITQVSFTTDRTPMVLTKNRPEVEGGLYLKIGSEVWHNESQTGLGNLALKVELNGEFLTAAADVANFRNAYVLKNDSHQASIFITNCGTENIEEINYILNIDGQESAEKHYVFTKTLKNLGYSSEVTIPIESGSTTGIKPILFRVTKINGKPNELATEGKSELFVIGQKVNKKVVEEEYTGTWCGWCPRGIKGMELSERIFGDNFIGIAIHYNDVMTCRDYFEYIDANVGGFPYCELNRAVSPDTYYNSLENGYGLDTHITEERSKLSPAIVKVEPFWTDNNKNSIMVKTNLNFQLNLNGQTPYALAYVMVANGLSGSGSSWQQKNFYSGNSKYANDENLAEYYNGSKDITDMVYNHVAIAGWNIGTKQTGLISGTFNEGESEAVFFTANLSENDFIKSPSKYGLNKDNIHLIAMLIDTNTGEIVNADQANLTVSDPDGITDAEDKTTDDGVIYDIGGQKVNTNGKLKKGIYIKNGKKFIVK